MAKITTPESLYGNSRDILREAERENEILADIAGEEYESPGDIPKGKYVIEKRLLDAAQKKNELLESIAEGGGGGGGGAAKAIGIDYATDVISLKDKDGETIAGSGATLPAYGVSFDPTTGGLTLTKNGTAVSGQTVTIPNYGSPVGVTSSSDMTDHDTIYLYEGTTSGSYTNGHFYYWDGSAWADGGEYAAATVQTDKTLLVEDRAADAKATGEAIGELKTQLNIVDNGLNNIFGLFHYDDFAVGAILKTNSVLSIDNTDLRMVSTPKSIVFRKEITITPKSGYRMFIHWTDGRNFSTSNTGWTTDAVTVQANQYFMITLRKVESDTGFIAEVETMVNQFSVSPSPLRIVEDIALAQKIMHVSTGGSDTTGVGSLKNPYASFSKAIAMGAEHIIARAGTYNETIAIDGGKIKISAYWETFVSGSVVNRPKIIIDGGDTIETALTIENCEEVILEDVVVQNCTADGALINKCHDIKIQNCEFSNNGANGIVIDYSNGVIRDCKASYNGNDGFNMNYFGDTQFFNCSGHDNGDDGISHHQGTTGAINGGEWYNNVKGGVASPAHGAQVDLLNFYSHDNGYGVYANADSDTTARQFTMFNCVLTNNSHYGLTCKRNTAVLYNCKIDGNTEGQTTAPSGGSIITL